MVARLYQSERAYRTARAHLTYICSSLIFRLLRNKPILCCTCGECFIATFHYIKVYPGLFCFASVFLWWGEERGEIDYVPLSLHKSAVELMVFVLHRDSRL